MNTLHLTEEQLRLVQQALDLYTRIGIGQFERIKDHSTFQKHLWNKLKDEDGETDFAQYHEIRDKADKKLMEARNIIIQENLHPNTSWSIFNEKVDESCRIAHDILRVIRHEFWKANPDRSELTVDANVDLQTKDSDKIKCKLNRTTDEVNTITFNGLEYNEVQSKTGRIWLDRNIGAKRVATSINDTEAYGNYYTFDEIECPQGYRLPTEDEWKAEILSWESDNWNGAFNSPLKLPSSGFSLLVHTFKDGDSGYYWSELVSISKARFLFISNDNVGIKTSNQEFGLSVRLIKE